MKRLAMGMAVAALASGCAEFGEAKMDWLTGGRTVEVTEVRRAQQCNSASDAARVWLFPDLGGARAWSAQRGIDLVGMEPLPPGPYAIVEHGARNTGGYGLAISRSATRRGDVLVLKATFMAPGAGRMVTQALTSPCVLVSLPQAEFGAVELVDQAGVRRASSAGELR